MIVFVHHHKIRPSFYRVDVGYNLFGEYSVVREWGNNNGHRCVHRISWFSNLREAVVEADKLLKEVRAKGYDLTLQQIAA